MSHLMLCTTIVSQSYFDRCHDNGCHGDDRKWSVGEMKTSEAGGRAVS